MALSAQDQAGLRAFLQAQQGNPLNQGLPAGTQPDNAWLSFLRGLGFTHEQAWRTAAAQIDRTKRQVGMQVADINEAGDEQRRNISNNAEARGIFRSGERLQDLARQRAAQQQDIAHATITGADTIGAVRTQLGGQEADLARQRADALLQLQQRNEARRLGASAGAYG